MKCLASFQHDILNIDIIGVLEVSTSRSRSVLTAFEVFLPSQHDHIVMAVLEAVLLREASSTPSTARNVCLLYLAFLLYHFPSFNSTQKRMFTLESG